MTWKREKGYTGPGVGDTCYVCVEHPEWSIRRFDKTARSRICWVVCKNDRPLDGDCDRDRLMDAKRLGDSLIRKHSNLTWKWDKEFKGEDDKCYVCVEYHEWSVRKRVDALGTFWGVFRDDKVLQTDVGTYLFETSRVKAQAAAAKYIGVR
jgi:hypothetical protein